jgi:hypothetical protein
MKTFKIFNKTIEIKDNVQAWYDENKKLEEEHQSTIEKVEDSLKHWNPEKLDGKDVHTLNKVLAQINVAATDQINVVVDKTIKNFQENKKWLNLGFNTNKDLLNIYAHTYDEDAINEHIEKIASTIEPTDNELKNKLYTEGFIPTYLTHFYNSVIKDNIHHFENSDIDYSFSKDIKPLDEINEHTIIEALKAYPFNVEIYKKAPLNEDLNSLMSSYNIPVKKEIIEHKKEKEAVVLEQKAKNLEAEKYLNNQTTIKAKKETEKKRKQVLENAERAKKDLNDSAYLKSFIEKHPNNTDEELAEIFFENHLLTTATYIDTSIDYFFGLLILTQLGLNPMWYTKKASKHDSAPVIINILFAVCMQAFLFTLHELRERDNRQISYPTDVPKPRRKVNPTVKKEANKAQNIRQEPQKNLSFFDWLLSLFK